MVIRHAKQPIKCRSLRKCRISKANVWQYDNYEVQAVEDKYLFNQKYTTFRRCKSKNYSL
jgi:hypothetical protein